MDKDTFTDSLKAALPVMAGYIVLGLPCGLLSQQAGMDWVMVLILSIVFYSGAGQYMIPNLTLAGGPIVSIIASVSLVNTRQTLYGASLSRFCENAGAAATFLFGATVTDESFGVNLARFENGNWDIKRATLVNLMCQSSWTAACVAGTLVGTLVAVPTAIASFAMTSIFICLLCMQKVTPSNVVAILSAVLMVYICKLLGLSGPAILLGALFGMLCGFVFYTVDRKSQVEGGVKQTDELD